MHSQETARQRRERDAREQAGAQSRGEVGTVDAPGMSLRQAMALVAQIPNADSTTVAHAAGDAARPYTPPADLVAMATEVVAKASADEQLAAVCAYLTYCDAVGGRSAVTGAPLPQLKDCPPLVQFGWLQVARRNPQPRPAAVQEGQSVAAGDVGLPEDYGVGDAAASLVALAGPEDLAGAHALCAAYNAIAGRQTLVTPEEFDALPELERGAWLNAYNEARALIVLPTVPKVGAMPRVPELSLDFLPKELREVLELGIASARKQVEGADAQALVMERIAGGLEQLVDLAKNGKAKAGARDARPTPTRRQKSTAAPK